MNTGITARLGKRLSAARRDRFRQRLCRLRRPAWLGTIRRTTPLSETWGYDRGTPVDRYYIEAFLAAHRHDIHGRVVEVKDRIYTERYGVDVQQSEVLDINPANPEATIIADLTAADAVTSNQFDCFILTQTLQFIYDTHAAIAEVHRLLRPGGVLLATVPVLGRFDRRLTDYWRFTTASCSALFGEVFGAEQVVVYSYGNVLTAIASLTGMAHEELSRRELEFYDRHYPVVVAIKAVKRMPDTRAEA